MRQKRKLLFRDRGKLLELAGRMQTGDLDAIREYHQFVEELLLRHYEFDDAETFFANASAEEVDELVKNLSTPDPLAGSGEIT